jgi:tRNA(adenine34) deaminase
VYLVDDEAAMAVALRSAGEAIDLGDVGVGAVVLAADGRLLAVRHDEVRSSGDPTAHASVLALRDASAASSSWRLLGAQLIVTREPCALCAGAAISARIARVAVGARDERHGCLGSRYHLGADPRLNHEIEVRVDVLGADCDLEFSRSKGDDVELSERPA